MSSKQQAEKGWQPAAFFRAHIGTVVTAVPDGKKPFAVAFPSNESVTKQITRDTSITFSLTSWTGNTPPEFGQKVALEGLKQFARGWRASAAHPITHEEL